MIAIKGYKTLVALAMAALMLVGCASSKKVAKDDDPTKVITPVEKAEFVNTLNAKRVGQKALTAKMNLTLASGGKDISVKGNFRVKRDDVIQLSLVFLGIKEVGRLELTRDSILVLDRINNQYVKAPYAQIPALSKAGIDFYSFQSLFWGELFLPGDKGAAPRDTDFTQKQVAKQVQLTHKDKNLMFDFIASVADGLLQSTKVSPTGTAAASVQATYANWAAVGGGQFPGRTELTLGAGASTYKATIALSDIKVNDKWDTRTVVNKKKYREVSVDGIMRHIMRLAN